MGYFQEGLWSKVHIYKIFHIFVEYLIYLIYSQNKFIEPYIGIDCFYEFDSFGFYSTYICLHVILLHILTRVTSWGDTYAFDDDKKWRYWLLFLMTSVIRTSSTWACAGMPDYYIAWEGVREQFNGQCSWVYVSQRFSNLGSNNNSHAPPGGSTKAPLASCFSSGFSAPTRRISRAGWPRARQWAWCRRGWRVCLACPAVPPWGRPCAPTWPRSRWVWPSTPWKSPSRFPGHFTSTPKPWLKKNMNNYNNNNSKLLYLIVASSLSSVLVSFLQSCPKHSPRILNLWILEAQKYKERGPYVVTFFFFEHLYLTPENDTKKTCIMGEIGQCVQNINTRYFGFNC